MALFMIATIHDNNEMIGVRLLDTNSKQIKDVPIREVITAIEKGITIQNIDVEQGQLVGTNGSIDRLPLVINGRLEGKSPLIILNQIGNSGYTVSDFKGQIKRLRNRDVIEYAKEHGIANGKIVQKGGNYYISSIIGSYEVMRETGDTPVIDISIPEIFDGELDSFLADKVATCGCLASLLESMI